MCRFKYCNRPPSSAGLLVKYLRTLVTERESTPKQYTEGQEPLWLVVIKLRITHIVFTVVQHSIIKKKNLKTG